MNLRTHKQQDGLTTLLHALFQEIGAQQEAIARVLVSHEARVEKLERQQRTSPRRKKASRGKEA